MSICPNTHHHCHSQPDEGMNCPHGPTPAEQPAPGDMFLAWWTSIETDTRKSLLVGAHRDPERLHALLRTAYETDRDQLPPSVVPIATSTDMARMMLALGHRYLQENAPEQLAQPAPASTGRGIAEEMCSTMMGVAELKLKMAKSKEQVEAALEISGARELDVEAERRAMFQAFSECLVHGNSMTPTEIADKLLAARSAAQGTAPASNAMMDAWSRYIFELEQKIVALEAQVAAQPESAPVSTEQAGDALGEVGPTIKDRLKVRSPKAQVDAIASLHSSMGIGTRKLRPSPVAKRREIQQGQAVVLERVLGAIRKRAREVPAWAAAYNSAATAVELELASIRSGAEVNGRLTTEAPHLIYQVELDPKQKTWLDVDANEADAWRAKRFVVRVLVSNTSASPSPNNSPVGADRRE